MLLHPIGDLDKHIQALLTSNLKKKKKSQKVRDLKFMSLYLYV